MKSNIEAELSLTIGRCDDLVVGDDVRAADFRKGNYGEHDAQETASVTRPRHHTLPSQECLGCDVMSILPR